QPSRARARGMEVVYHHLRETLEDILQLASASGARVLLSAVASNLKDCPPFASLHGLDLTPAQQAEWDKLYLAGIQAEKTTKYDEALPDYQQAAQLDNRFAELFFRLGRCQ